MKPLLIIKAGHASDAVRSNHCDFDDMILSASGVEAHKALVVPVYRGDMLPDPETVCGAVITGSGAMVTSREPWSLLTESWIIKAHRSGIPLLGICYGHQLIAQAFGGSVGYHPLGIEVGTVPILKSATGASDPLFSVLPENFWGHEIHYQSVLQLPEGAVLLAGNAHDPHQGFRLGPSTWGVQFHPEFTEGILADYIQQESRYFKKTDEELASIRMSLRSHPYGIALLQQFRRLVLGS